MSKLVIRFLNVGQGDAIHMQLPNGEHLLCDSNRDRKNRGINLEKFLSQSTEPSAYLSVEPPTA